MGKNRTKIKLYGLLIILFITIVVNYKNAFAQLSVALPVYGELVGGKDSPFKGAPLTQTQPSYADPFNHRDFATQHDVNGMVYYLPPGVVTHEQRIHSDYTANTDACASCHFTHTALAPNLLQWPSVYEACISCHDGTLGDYTYDVISGLIPKGGQGVRIRTYGGLFGDFENINETAYNTSLSTHMPDASVLLADPLTQRGGNPNVDSQETLGCVSCHTPHGQGGNARILNPDPNKLRLKKYRDGLSSVDFATYSDLYLRWLETLGGANDNVYKDPADIQNWIPGYPYSTLTKVMISESKPTVKLENGALKLYGGDYLNPEYYQIDYRDGQVILTAEGMTVKQGKEVYAIYVPGIYIAMEITGYLTPSEKVTYLAKDKHNRPTSINKFCEVCHYDYNTEHVNEKDLTIDPVNPRTGVIEPYGSAKKNSGLYSKAFRHQVGNLWIDDDWGRDETPSVLKFAYDGNTRIITCLTCHLAHGVDKEYWKDTNNGYINYPVNDDGYVYDVNPSSALKRLPNMAVCEACHQMKYAYQGRTGPK